MYALDASPHNEQNAGYYPRVGGGTGLCAAGAMPQGPNKNGRPKAAHPNN
jgi:hypothetical protein